MSVLGITLLILGVIIFAVSFFLPDKEENVSRKDKEKQREEIRKMMEKELDGMKLRVNEATNETVKYGMDECERSLEKISNEKIMAVSEYASTIMEEIENNHKEIMFLYDMLNNKQVDLKNTVRKAEAAAKEVDEMVNEAASRAYQNPEVSNVNVAPVISNVNQSTVAYHGVIDESIFENMTRNDIAEQPVAVETPVYQMPQVQPAVQQAPQIQPAPQMPQVTSLFNSAIANENGFQFENEIKVETIERKEEPVIETVNVADDYRTATFNESGNNNQKILRMYDEGMDVVDIARELNLGVGEVKLVIDLFKF